MTAVHAVHFDTEHDLEPHFDASHVRGYPTTLLSRALSRVSIAAPRRALSTSMPEVREAAAHLGIRV